MRGASLRGANLSKADLTQADFREGQIAVMNPSKGLSVLKHKRTGELDDVNFSGATLDGSKLNGSTACQADFTDCSMRGAKLAQANLKDANLSGAMLQDAEVSGCNLEGANLSGAVLTGVDTAGGADERRQSFGRGAGPSPGRGRSRRSSGPRQGASGLVQNRWPHRRAGHLRRQGPTPPRRRPEGDAADRRVGQRRLLRRHGPWRAASYKAPISRARICAVPI